MKKLGFVFSMCLAIMLAAPSCVKTNFKTEIQLTDSLLMEVNKHKATMDAIDLEMVDTLSDKTKKILNKLHEYYDSRDLALPLEDGIVFGNFKAVKKGFRNFDKRFENIQKEIAYSQKQLNAFKFDLEQGALAKELASQYLAEEKQAVDILGKEVLSLTEGVNFASERYKQMLPEMKEKMSKIGIIDSIAW